MGDKQLDVIQKIDFQKYLPARISGVEFEFLTEGTLAPLPYPDPVLAEEIRTDVL